MPRSILYSDLDVNLDGPLVYNKQAVEQALINLFSTGITERTFRPEIAGSVDDLLFENLDNFTAFAIRHRLFQCIEEWDGRVEVDTDRSSVTPDPDNNRYYINLVLSIKGLSEDKSSVQLYLNRS